MKIPKMRKPLNTSHVLLDIKFLAHKHYSAWKLRKALRQRATLANAIEHSFQNAIPPSGEWTDTSSLLTGTYLLQGGWQTIPVQTITVRSNDLWQLPPAVLAYYLPAFLLLCLRDPNTAGALLSSIIYELAPSFTGLTIADQEIGLQKLEEIIAKMPEGSTSSLRKHIEDTRSTYTKYASVVDEEHEKQLKLKRVEEVKQFLTPVQKKVLYQFFKNYKYLYPNHDISSDPINLYLQSTVEFWKN
jgi:hypothetical protein